MAVSPRVVGAQEPIIGIKAETSYGVAIDGGDPDGTDFRKLPLVQAQRPAFNIIRESRLLSGRGMVKNSADQYSTGIGGTVVTPFDFWATPKLLSQILVLVGQQHSESGSAGSEVHTVSFDDSGMINEIGGSITNNIPHSVNLAYDLVNGVSESLLVPGNVVSDLSLVLDAGANGGLLSMSGNFFSGHCAQSGTSLVLETSFDGSWVAPETSYYSYGGLTTKTLDSDDGSAQDLIFRSIQFDISNGVNRVGANSTGNAEALAIPEYVIAGSMMIKYDDNFDNGATRNVLQDFIDGDTLSLALQWGNGTVDAAGEMNIDAELQYTGSEFDLSESGIFHSLPFECVVNGSTPAFKVQNFTGESQSAW